MSQMAHRATITLTATSSGNSAASLSSVSLSGSGFSMGTLALPLSLSPGQSLAISVTFGPKTTGTVNGSLTFVTNCTTGATVDRSLDRNRNLFDSADLPERDFSRFWKCQRRFIQNPGFDYDLLWDFPADGELALDQRFGILGWARHPARNFGSGSIAHRAGRFLAADRGICDRQPDDQ